MTNLTEFCQQFLCEDYCNNHLKKSRESQGITCKKCGGKSHYWLKNKKQWQCKSCDFRTTLKSGTLFHASNIKLNLWYQVIFLMTNSKKPISAAQMKRLIGMKRYEPVWYMMHKIRFLMHKINNSSPSPQFDTYTTNFKIIAKSVNKKNDLFYDQEIQALLLEKKEGSFEKNIKMIVFPFSTKEFFEAGPSEVDFIMPIVNQLEGGPYRTAFKKPNLHIQIINEVKNSKLNKWVHFTIQNVRNTIYGIHHFISKKYAQLYFEEFCFKYNHRNNDNLWKILFDRVLSFFRYDCGYS